MTTIPSRIDKIRKTVACVLNQTYPVHHLDMNIPLVCVRTGEPYTIPSWLHNSKIRIYRTDDYGSATKVVPTLIRYKNNEVYVWSVDDDIEYPLDTLAHLMKSADSTRIVAQIGCRWTETAFEWIRTGNVDFFEGFGTVLYPPRCIDGQFEKYMHIVSEYPDCRKSDDIVLSNYFHYRKIPIYTNIYYNVLLFVTPYGSDVQSLHLQDGGHLPRYLSVVNWLRDRGLWFNVRGTTDPAKKSLQDRPSSCAT